MINKRMRDYGYTEFFNKQIKTLDIEDMELIPARVIEVHREEYKIVTEDGENTARLKSSLFYNDENSIYPAIGDFVLVMRNPYGEDVIYRVLERKSKFSRMDTWNGKEQIIATNFDYVFIISSLNQDFNMNKMERYISTSWESGGNPVIILTKADLCHDYSKYIENLEQIAIGVPIIIVSAHTGIGLEEVKNYIKASKTVVFLGSSGVGKSSLVNAIAGKEIMKINDIRSDDDKGRHTTTHRQLIMLENGSMIIDTPGMRELGMWDVSEGISMAFNEIENIAKNCKFSDCNHISEPGCAVKAAMEIGEISRERWESYTKLKKEAAFAKKKEDVNLMLKEKSYKKNISKFQKSLKKNR